MKMTNQTPVSIPVDKLHPFVGHPYKVKDDEEMNTLIESIDLRVLLETIRKCTDLKELNPTLVNTLIKRIEVHNSARDSDGIKHVPIDIFFTAVGIIDIPTEQEVLKLIEEMRENPLKTA